MGNGIKHEEEILKQIREFMQNSNGIISQDNVINIIAKFYSQNYSELGGLSSITRVLNQKGIATKVKVKIPQTFVVKSSSSKHAPPQQFITVFVDSSIPQDKKSKLITEYIKNAIHTLAPTFHRSVSREILAENPTNLAAKNQPDTEFFSVKTRASLLHLFLVHNFHNRKLDINLLLNSMPIGLIVQIFRSIDSKYFCLHPSIIVPLQQDKIMELNMMIAMLKPPYNPLIIDNVIKSNAEVEITNLNFSKNFDFVFDPAAHYQYWSLVNSIANIPPQKFPITVIQRFEPYLNSIYSESVLFSLPFFPREVEEASVAHYVPPPALSYYLQKLYKKKLRVINHPRRSFLETHLFPSSGIYSMIISGKSALPSLVFSPPSYFSEEFEVDKSLKSIAKLFLASRLSSDGFILSKRSNYEQLKEKCKIWIKENTKISNFKASMFDEKYFIDTYNEVVANVMVVFHGLVNFDIDVTQTVNATCEEINSLYTASKNTTNLERSTSVAFEFLKSILQTEYSQRNETLSVRQLCHLSTESIGNALWMLSSIGLLTMEDHKGFITLPKCEWLFDDYKALKDSDPFRINVIPRPGHIFSFFSDDRKFEIEWSGKNRIEKTDIYSVFTPEVVNISESKIYKFDFVPIKEKYPKLKIPNSPKEINQEKMNEEILSTDPLSVYSFARIETDDFVFPDLMDRYLFGLISGAGVDGIGILEIACAFDASVTSQLFMQFFERIEVFIRLNLVCRVPTSSYEPVYSRYPCCHMIAKNSMNKIDLIPVHLWINENGDVVTERIDELRKNIVVFVLSHELCTFEELLEAFPYISPNDLCFLLDALESDEVLASQYSFEGTGGLYDKDVSLCSQEFKNDIFLSIVAEHKALGTESKLVRRIRTTTSSLYNVCL